MDLVQKSDGGLAAEDSSQESVVRSQESGARSEPQKCGRRRYLCGDRRPRLSGRAQLASVLLSLGKNKKPGNPKSPGRRATLYLDAVLAQNLSNAAVRSAAMSSASRVSMSLRCIM